MESTQYLEDQLKKENISVPSIGIILGSGIGQLTEDMDIQLEIPYESVPNLEASTVEGHEGRYIVGEIGGARVIGMDGRLHYYETGDIQEVVKPLKAICELGFEKLIITNASGSVNSSYDPGDTMILKDHINMIGSNPLIGHSDDYPGDQFPDQTNVYSPDLIENAVELSKSHDLTVHQGVYVAMQGPTYETPAEVNMVDVIGGDVVGMSTVPEAIVANQYDIDVFAISTVTNYAAGISEDPLSHDEVIETIEDIKPDLIMFVKELIELM